MVHRIEFKIEFIGLSLLWALSPSACGSRTYLILTSKITTSDLYIKLPPNLLLFHTHISTEFSVKQTYLPSIGVLWFVHTATTHMDQRVFGSSMFLCFLTLIIWNDNVVVVPQAEARAFFVFGDSLVDNGNNNYLLTTARADAYPYGIDYPTHRATGRFSNGLNIPDIISWVPNYVAVLINCFIVPFNYVFLFCDVSKLLIIS